jgi:hypothetical protein
MARYDMALLGSELGLMERFFLTRENGEQAYPLLEARLHKISEGQPLVLAFPPGQLMDSSFADETVVRLGEEINAAKFGERCILLEGLTADSTNNINAAISLRRLRLAFLAVEPTVAWQLIGRLEPSLQETLEIVAKRSRLTAPELADLKKLAINSASNRLKRLYDQHLIRRKHEISEKGLQYIYYFWQWTEDQTDQGKEVER